MKQGESVPRNGVAAAPKGRFGFIIHPLVARDIARKYPVARYLSDRWIERIIRYIPPREVSHITGVRSRLGPEAEGWFVGCSLTSRQILTLPEPFVIGRIAQAARKAAELGARIVGLGAFTAVVADGGISVARQVDVPITTGNSYTVATALRGLERACDAMGIALPEATVAVLGATGSIGGACARILAGRVGRLILVGRDRERLARLAGELEDRGASSPSVTTDVGEGVRQADAVVAVTSALEAIVDAADLRPGAVVCDVARPRNVARAVAEARDDVLVFEGGVVAVPGDVDFHFDFGFPVKTAYACMAETMILALEGRYEPFSLGKELSVERVEEIDRLAQKHGFELCGLRSFERALDEGTIARIRERAERARRRLAVPV